MSWIKYNLFRVHRYQKLLTLIVHISGQCIGENLTSVFNLSVVISNAAGPGKDNDQILDSEVVMVSPVNAACQWYLRLLTCIFKKN